MACPICKKPTDPTFQPFCSERCKLVDLNRWFSGSYAIPSQEEPSEADLMAALPQKDEDA